jgi:branched-chain amino acid transport system ATP-binding protein
MPFIMNICDRVIVLNFGRVVTQGRPAQVRDDPAVIEAYLGAAQ